MNLIKIIIIISLASFIWFIHLKRKNLKEELFIFHIELPYLEFERKYIKEKNNV